MIVMGPEFALFFRFVHSIKKTTPKRGGYYQSNNMIILRFLFLLGNLQ